MRGAFRLTTARRWLPAAGRMAACGALVLAGLAGFVRVACWMAEMPSPR